MLDKPVATAGGKVRAGALTISGERLSMINLPVYDRQGNVVEQVEFDESFLGELVNYPLLHSAIVMYEANQRLGTAKTKGIREIAGSTKKPYRQKGTGNARMGTKRRVGSRHGATCHGPQPRDHSWQMPKKMRRAALRSALLSRFKDNEVVIVSDLTQAAPRTSEIAQTLQKIQVNNSRCLLISENYNETLLKSVRNLAKAKLSNITDLNAWVVLQPQKLVITKAALNALPELFK